LHITGILKILIGLGRPLIGQKTSSFWRRLFGGGLCNDLFFHEYAGFLPLADIFQPGQLVEKM
jgi:hypothetical protein